MLSFHQAVEDDFAAVNTLIIEQLHSRVALVENIGHYIVDAGGKRLRPLLVLLIARALGVKDSRHIDMAAIVEFIHTATLLHDDVVDVSALRRGRVTANAQWMFGDALANLLAFTGFKVTREYYINDAGAQVDVLARSAYLRYREALGEEIGTIPEGLYPGEYLKPVGAQLGAELGASLERKPESEWLPIVRDRAISMMMAEIRDDLLALNVVQDVFFSERSLIDGPRDQVADTIAALRRAGYVYE
ncbi:MAG TPA: polyprenyl synthetase family protein, partial [Pseudomonadales bacterium]|nr:polyprenyl synthetase family protein [Pseudomonadales bacterium]